MMRARQGRVVAIGSVAALRGNPGNAAYAASKGALISYCKTLAVEAARRGVTVNVIAPGFVDTAMLAPYADYRERMEAQIPAGRFGRPEEVASLAAYLMGEGAAYVTGAVLPVDGGLAAQLGIHR
jgi:NAD(P)-dependent dehydrogenase (short-subunit alcohol dehydrogenase family)